MTPEVVPFAGLAVNQQVELELNASGERPKKLLSRVEDVAGRQVLVAQPTFRSRPVRLPAGGRVVLTWYTLDAVYKCEATLLAQEPGSVPMWRLEVPVRVTRIQRRGFVRIEVGLDARYTVLARPEGGGEAASGAGGSGPARPAPAGGGSGPAADSAGGYEVRPARTRDLSAGGCQLVTDEPLAPGTVLELTLDLAPGQRFSTIGEVVRLVTEPPSADGRPGKSVLGINFVGLDRRDQDFLCGYVFSRQRELRRKGLL